MADHSLVQRFKIADTDEPKEDGYDAWKRAKIMKSLDESRDLETLLTAEEVWKKLGLKD